MESERILRVAEVRERTGLSRVSIYEMSKDGRFPRPARIGKNAVGWFKSEIDAWIAQKFEERAA